MYGIDKGHRATHKQKGTRRKKNDEIVTELELVEMPKFPDRKNVIPKMWPSVKRVCESPEI